MGEGGPENSAMPLSMAGVRTPYQGSSTRILFGFRMLLSRLNSFYFYAEFLCALYIVRWFLRVEPAFYAAYNTRSPTTQNANDTCKNVPPEANERNFVKLHVTT